MENSLIDRSTPINTNNFIDKRKPLEDEIYYLRNRLQRSNDLFERILLQDALNRARKNLFNVTAN